MALPDQVEVPYISGHDIGIGVNYSSGGPKNKAVKGVISPPEVASGNITRFKIERVHTTSEIEQVLQIAATASYGVAAFCGAEARFAFAKSAKVQSSSLIMLVHATVQRAFQQIDEVTLTDPASDVADQPALFAERYGNMFVRGINSGGLFVGYYRIDTGSSEISDQIAAELEGSYGLFSGQAELKFENVQRKFRTEVAIDIYSEGGPTNLQINSLNDPMELLRSVQLFLRGFQEQPDQVARPYSVTLAPLAIANGPNPPNEADLQHAQDVLIFCAKRRSTLVDQLNTYQYIVDKPLRFDFSNGARPEEVRVAAETVQSDLDLIARCASRAMNDPKNAKFPEAFASSVGEVYPRTTAPALLPSAKPVGPTVPIVIGLEAYDAMTILVQAGIPARLNCCTMPAEYEDVRNRVLAVFPREGRGIMAGAKAEIYVSRSFEPTPTMLSSMRARWGDVLVSRFDSLPTDVQTVLAAGKALAKSRVENGVNG